MNTTIANQILDEVKKASSILLHCHPSPDPDSVGSALSMKFVLEGMGKKVTVIQGDSTMPRAFIHFPGATEIIPKNYHEIDIKEFDLFIVLDSSANGVSRKQGPDVVFPPELRVVNIDHHRTNKGCGAVNFVDPTYPATCLMLYDLFKEWGVKLDTNIASNLFIGTYTDTGGFKYEGVKPETYLVAGELARHIPDLPGLIAKMENSTTLGFLKFQAAALGSITVYHDGILALALVPYSVIKAKGLVEEDIQPSRISSFLRTVPDWKIVACGIEIPEGEVKFSFRSSDSKTYDVSKLTAELGGGGHKAAAGVRLLMPFDEAVKKVVETTKIIYNL